MRKAMSASSWATIWVFVSPMGRSVIVSASSGPSMVDQETRSSGDRSMIWASNSRRFPSTSMIQWVWSAPVDVTCRTPVMKRG
jgi:hypothetical protein